ncbi:MAG TPA: GMC family oxidoreductase [Acidisarcina sp.]
MQIMDLRKMRAPGALTSDICIVGSGPAGLTIANELANTDLDLIVLESGGRHREDPFSAALNQIESVGEPRVMEQRKVRNRILGGTSHTWSGRCIRLDEIDYQARSWVPDSGWPITAAEMAHFLERSASYLGVIAEDSDHSMLAAASLPDSFHAEDKAEVRSVFWQFSRGSSFHNDYVRFGPQFAKLAAPNIRTILNATATNIITNVEGNHVQEMEVTAPSGAIHRVRSRCFVLCGGGIENPRIMLASTKNDPRGIGNRQGLVGRFLMDHPRAVIGTFAPGSIPAVQSEFGLFDYRDGARLQRGLSLSFDVQRKERLLNCAAWTTQHVAEDDVWRALRAMARIQGREKLAQSRMILRHADQILMGMWQKFVLGSPLPRRMKQLNVEVMIEQRPDQRSRITLSHRKDALGVPLAKIDWKIGEMERRTAVRLGNAFNDALARAGLPTAELVEWVRDNHAEAAVFTDPAHPMGTTRMAQSAQHGVVDRECKVFGVDNLYVAGSSVFPTGGHANPTLTIVALAVRLADRLRQEFDQARSRHGVIASVAD